MRSVVNTRLWEKYGNSEEISVFESELPEYLYDFDTVRFAIIPGVPVEKVSVF